MFSIAALHSPVASGPLLDALRKLVERVAHDAAAVRGDDLAESDTLRPRRRDEKSLERILEILESLVGVLLVCTELLALLMPTWFLVLLLGARTRSRCLVSDDRLADRLAGVRVRALVLERWHAPNVVDCWLVGLLAAQAVCWSSVCWPAELRSGGWQSMRNTDIIT